MKDKILMPRELTADNGAKGLLIGEFHESLWVGCGECYGDKGDCPACGGEGGEYIKAPVKWDTIKDIYKMAVKHFGDEVDD